ncbi:hypothetical protein, partial [Endozoicomonas acroporae]
QNLGCRCRRRHRGGLILRGKVVITTAVNSRVKTSGAGADAGIGEGYPGPAANTTAVNSYVNGIKENFGSISNDQLLCQKADLRLLTANCSSRTEFQDALDFSNSNACPVNVATVSTAAKESTAAAAAATVLTDATASTPTTVSTDVTASTAATLGGITTGSLLAGGLGLGIVGYSSYQWITGYREGLRGQKLAMKPLTRGRELASAAVNSVSQGIQGIRERMSSTNFGRNRAEPMPPPASGRPRAERPLPAPPLDHYQPLSFRPRNTRPLPAPRQDQYQPLSFRSRNTRPLPPLPGHYQTLTFRQGNTATGDYNPLMGNEKEPAPSDIPVYLELIGYESTDNHGEPVADGQAGIATGGSNPLVGNEKEPAPP